MVRFSDNTKLKKLSDGFSLDSLESQRLSTNNGTKVKHLYSNSITNTATNQNTNEIPERNYDPRKYISGTCNAVHGNRFQSSNTSTWKSMKKIVDTKYLSPKNSYKKSSCDEFVPLTCNSVDSFLPSNTLENTALQRPNSWKYLPLTKKALVFSMANTSTPSTKRNCFHYELNKTLSQASTHPCAKKTKQSELFLEKDTMHSMFLRRTHPVKVSESGNNL